MAKYRVRCRRGPDSSADDSENEGSNSSMDISLPASNSTEGMFSSSSESLSQGGAESAMSQTRSEGSQNSSNRSNHGLDDSSNSADTEEYELPENIRNVTGGASEDELPIINPHHPHFDIPFEELITIPDTQAVDEAGAACANIEDDDDDVILIPQHVETIDLCTQAPMAAQRRPMTFSDEVIVIQDSPAAASGQRGSAIRTDRKSTGGRRRALEVSPYKRPNDPSTSKANSPETQNSQSVLITCPICFDSVSGRAPVSTTCGHIFCKNCLTEALTVSKCCPMCRKSLKAKNSYHSLHFGV